MASISSITLPNNDVYDIKDARLSGIITVKGTQTATTASWTGAINIPALYDGLTIAYYLPRTSASNVTLNLTLSDGTTTGAVPVYVTSTTRMGTHYGAGSTIVLTYWSAGSILINGTATTENRWTHGDYWQSNTVPSAYCTTGAGTAAKTASCTDYALLTNSYLHVLIKTANTVQGAITLNVNSKGAKPIYINGQPSSSTNHTLPAGTYITFYDGTAYHFRTDGKLPGTIDVPIATTSSAGIVQPDNTSITINNGVISSTPEIAIQDTQPTSDALVWIDTDAEGADFCFVGPNEPPTDGSVTVWIDTTEDEIPIQQGAAGVKYNNTQSGLTTTNVQGAIDELGMLGNNMIIQPTVSTASTGSSVTFATNTLPKGYKWLIIGNLQWSVSNNGTITGRFNISGTETVIAPTSRGAASGGGGVIMYAYCLTENAARTVSVTSYVTLSGTFNHVTNYIAIPIQKL